MFKCGLALAGAAMGAGAGESPAQTVKSVERLWATSCAGCHGERGQGGGAGTRTLLTGELFGQEHDRPFFDAIKNGVPESGMEAFGETHPDADCWALVVHIRELQARAARERSDAPKAVEGVYSSNRERFKVETVIGKSAGLETPWSVDFLPDGRMLVTERPGRLRVFAEGKLGQPVAGTPKVRNRGQGGLMDVAPHPRFAENGWVYLAFTDERVEKGQSLGFTKIVRGRLDGNSWTDQRTIFEARPEHYLSGDIHFGCRLVFERAEAGERYYLFFGLGERGRGELAPDLTRPNGKVHRVWDDGEVPGDNPFAGIEVDQRTVWSLGHRNPQGLVLDQEGRLFDTEHGPRGGDELNLVQKGRNYGWPTWCFGINYNDSPYRTPWPGGETVITMPVMRWLPSIAACGLDVARGPAFPGWKGDLLAGGLAGQTVQRVRVSSGPEPKLVECEELVNGLGRVRDVVCGPGGSIYVVLNDPDVVVRLAPVEGIEEKKGDRGNEGRGGEEGIKQPG